MQTYDAELRAALEPFGAGLVVSATDASHGRVLIEAWCAGHLLVFRTVTPQGRSARATVDEVLRLDGNRIEQIFLRLTGARRTNAALFGFPEIMRAERSLSTDWPLL